MINSLKKAISGLCLTALFFSTVPADVEATEYYGDMGGNGYAESSTTSYMGPAIALGTIAAVAIIAVAVQNNSNSHSH